MVFEDLLPQKISLYQVPLASFPPRKLTMLHVGIMDGRELRRTKVRRSVVAMFIPKIHPLAQTLSGQTHTNTHKGLNHSPPSSAEVKE